MSYRLANGFLSTVCLATELSEEVLPTIATPTRADEDILSGVLYSTPNDALCSMGAIEDNEEYQRLKNDKAFMASPEVANPSAISPRKSFGCKDLHASMSSYLSTLFGWNACATMHIVAHTPAS